jgi:hypothetical protein
VVVPRLTEELWLIEAGIKVLGRHWFERAASSNK